jgi:hypothetical protein
LKYTLDSDPYFLASPLTKQIHKMKVTNLLLLGVAVILFSCGDDDPKPSASQKIVGAWAITAVDYKGTTTSTVQGSTIKTDFSGTGKTMNLTATFGSNPNTVKSEGSYTLAMTSTTSGQTINTEWEFDGIFTDGTWSLNDNALTITNANGTDTATIVELTSTSLKFDLNTTDSDNTQGMTVTTAVQATYTFKKK